MRVALTGHTGFIGRHVLAELRRRNVDVIVLARRFDESLPDERITKIPLDIQQVSHVTFQGIGAPDVLIHAAWGGLPNYNSLHHIEVEMPTQYAFLSRLIKTGLPALVVTGTCFEYGMQDGQLKEDRLTAPQNCYGLAKDSLYKQLEMLKAHHPFKIAWARLFYLYGEGQGRKALLSQLCDAVSNHQSVFNMSGGEQLRDYLPVEEATRYLVDLALMSADCGAVNVCSGEPISVKQLVLGWLEQNNWSIELNLGYYPYPDYEPMAFWGDNAKLKSILETIDRIGI